MEQVIALLAKFGVTEICPWNSYASLPQEHFFAARRIAKRSAKGADGYALYWERVCEVRLCYREMKTDEDERLERRIENELRKLTDLESEYEYYPNEKLFVTVYSFSDCEKFEEE